MPKPAAAFMKATGWPLTAPLPMVVVLPETTAQVVEVLRYCSQEGIKVVPRGAGTSLSGGALPLADGVLLGMGKFKKILEIDYANRCVVAQPGVTNLAITQAVQDQGFYYAPDPSSQIACTVGGNVAENSGGVHCLKYGLTTNNVIGIEMVTIDGEVLRLGGKHADAGGYDLLGVAVGSEGLLGVVTEVTMRILPKPPGARALLIGFPDVGPAGDCVAAIIAAGIIPAGMEMMDRLATEAAEAFVHAGYPLDAEAVLIVELDGIEAEIEHLVEKVRQFAVQFGATYLPDQHLRGRKNAVLGRAQGGVSRRRPHIPGLLLHGWYHSTRSARKCPDPYGADEGGDAGLGGGVGGLAEIAALASDGGHQDEAAATGSGPEMLYGGAGTGEGAAEMGRDDGVEIGVRGVPQHAVAQDAGVGAHGVEAAEGLERTLDTERGGFGGADRGHRGDSPATVALDPGHRRFGQRGIDVVDHHRRTGGGERAGGLEADPLPCPGNDRYFAIQSQHHRPLYSGARFSMKASGPRGRPPSP